MSNQELLNEALKATQAQANWHFNEMMRRNERKRQQRAEIRAARAEAEAQELKAKFPDLVNLED